MNVRAGLARLERPRAGRPARHAVHGHALIHAALDGDWDEFAVAVGTQEQLVFGLDRAADHEAGDHGADTRHRERVVEVHQRLVPREGREASPRREMVEEGADEVQAFARDARHLKDRGYDTARDVLHGRHDVTFVFHEKRRLALLQKLLQGVDGRVSVLCGGHINFGDDHEKWNLQAEHDRKVFLGHPDDATAVGVDAHHAKIGLNPRDAVHGRAQVPFVTRQVAEVNDFARSRHNLVPSKLVRLSNLRV